MEQGRAKILADQPVCSFSPFFFACGAFCCRVSGATCRVGLSSLSAELDMPGPTQGEQTWSP